MADLEERFTPVNRSQLYASLGLPRLIALGSCALLLGCDAGAIVEPPTVFVSLKPVNDRVDASEQWSGWRGGLRHGVAERTFPTSWQSEQGLRWKVSVPGKGNSSPVVWGEHVLLTTVEVQDGVSTAKVLDYDRKTGDEIWQTTVGTPQGTAHRKNGFASPTVATDGLRLFASFHSLGLFALDLQGNILWQTDATRGQHEWGQAASPVLFESLVICVCDSEDSSHIVAFDQANGNEIWRTSRTSRGSWSSPVLMNSGSTVAPKWQVIVNGTGSGSSSAGEVIAYDPRSGAEIWKVRGTTDIACPTAIVGDNLIISATGGNGPIFAIRPDGQGDVSASHVRWRLPSGGPYVPTGVIYRERLYLISDGGVATCHRLDDGTILWRKRLQGTFSASLVAGGGHLYAVSERGDVTVFKATDQFELVATNRMHEPCLATPALVGGEIIFRTRQELICVGHNTLATRDTNERTERETATITTRSPVDVDTSTLSTQP